MAQLVASMSGVVLGGVAEVVDSNLAKGKIFTASIGSVDSLYQLIHFIHPYYTIAIKLSIFFYMIPIFEVMKNNLVLGFIRHVHLYFGYKIWITLISFIYYCP